MVLKRKKSILRKPAQGLLDRGKFPLGYDSVIKMFVVDVPWADLQPTKGGPIVRNNAIDLAIAQAVATGLTIKLRVAAGIDAPEWAKTLDGPPMTFYFTDHTVASAGEVAGTVGRFWTPKFKAAYVDLQIKLAAIYDTSPQVRQVSITQAGTIFSETYLRNASDQRNVDALLAAGFSVANDNQAHADQIVAHQVWKRTRSGLTFNPYQSIQPDGSVKQDLDYTLTQMDNARFVLGARLVLENYSLSQDRVTSPDYGAIYDRMQTLGAPFDFQTATYAKVGDLLWVLDWAAKWGANSVELPSGYKAYTPAQLVPAQNALVANPTK